MTDIPDVTIEEAAADDMPDGREAMSAMLADYAAATLDPGELADIRRRVADPDDPVTRKLRDLRAQLSAREEPDRNLTIDEAAGELLGGAKIFMCGNGQLSVGKPEQVVVYRYMCPWCAGTGRWGTEEDCERCQHCNGARVTNDVAGWEESELVRTPRPPAVMRSPCVDCAYRPGSPEHDAGTAPGPETPFYCHHGMIRDEDGYITPAYVGNLPLGAHVCAGWWALATGEQLPAQDFRDPGGADRAESTPDADLSQFARTATGDLIPEIFDYIEGTTADDH